MRTSGLALRSDKIEPTLQDARGLELGEGAAHIALAGIHRGFVLFGTGPFDKDGACADACNDLSDHSGDWVTEGARRGRAGIFNYLTSCAMGFAL
jgi:hypothetical protein